MLIQHHFLTVLIDEFIFQWVEGQTAGYCVSGYNFRRSNKSVCRRKTVVAFGEVPVEGGHNGILPGGIIDMTGPLTDTRTAGISEYHTTDLVKCIQVTVSVNGKTNQFRTRSNRK